MKWAAIGLGAFLLALAVGALALTTRGGGQSARIATTTVAYSPIDALIPVATPQPSRPVSPAKKRRSGASVSKKCRSNAGDESDATGDDRSKARNCGSNSSGDNQAGDNQRDQSGDAQAGDTSSGDNAGDNQAGDNAGGNQP
jgi:hypothetical protein